MAYLSINDSEREAAQGLANLKNYSKEMLIWEQRPSLHSTDQHNAATFSYHTGYTRNIFIFPELHNNTPSPPGYYYPTPPCSHQNSVHTQSESLEKTHDQDTDSVYMEESSDQKEKGCDKKNRQGKAQKKKSKRKPRWNKDLKNSLSLAVIDQKKLSDVTSFDWQAIGRKTGKSGKACKRQWLTEILPKIQNSYKNY